MHFSTPVRLGRRTDDGVGDNAKLSTGSGSIHATGLQGGFTVNTGSGDIYAEQNRRGRRESPNRLRERSNSRTSTAACAPAPDRATSR